MQLETLLLTLYYPTTPPSSRFPWLNWHHVHPHWLSATTAQSALGYSAFAKKNPWIIGALTRVIGGRLRLSAWLGGELAEPTVAAAEGEKPAMSERQRSVGRRQGGGSGETLVGEEGEKVPGAFPLVVFSHGLAGTRTTYRSVAPAVLDALP